MIDSNDKSNDAGLDDDLFKELGLEPKPSDDLPPLTEEAPLPPPVSSRKKNPIQEAPSQGDEVSRGVKKMADNLPVEVVVVLGKKTLPLRDALSFKEGDLIDLNRNPHEALDLMVNGKTVGRGELVLIDGKMGLKIKHIQS